MIPERIIFVSRGISVLLCDLFRDTERECDVDSRLVGDWSVAKRDCAHLDALCTNFPKANEEKPHNPDRIAGASTGIRSWPYRRRREQQLRHFPWFFHFVSSFSSHSYSLPLPLFVYILPLQIIPFHSPRLVHLILLFLLYLHPLHQFPSATFSSLPLFNVPVDTVFSSASSVTWWAKWNEYDVERV